MSMLVSGIRFVSILNYIDYQKSEAMRVLEDELEWVYYGGKHHESVYTRFYQAYVLPEKFGIDKRRLHESDLIRAGQRSRDEALKELTKPACDPAILRQDRPFVCKKLGLHEEAFQDIMAAAPKDFTSYPNNFNVIMRAKSWMTELRVRGRLPR
jgi:hypothetical protein